MVIESAADVAQVHMAAQIIDETVHYKPRAQKSREPTLPLSAQRVGESHQEEDEEGCVEDNLPYQLSLSREN